MAPQDEAGEKTTEIGIESGIHRETGGPLVRLQWGAMRAVLSPEEARAHALNLLSAAEAADTDAFLARFLSTQIGASEAGVAQVIGAFHEWRHEERV